MAHILRETGVLGLLPLPNKIFSTLTPHISSQHEDVPETAWNWLDIALPTLTTCIEKGLWAEARNGEQDFSLDPRHFRFWLLFSLSFCLVKSEQPHFRMDHRTQSTAKISFVANSNLLSSCLLEWIQPFLSTMAGAQQERGQVTCLENLPCNHSITLQE